MAQNQVEILGRVTETPLGRRIPLFAAGVPAGFPSPADDYIDRHLDLHEHLIEHPAATFYVRASGDSMVGAGIHDGDLLIVDRAVEPRDGHIVIAVVHGELTVKRLRRRRRQRPDRTRVLHGPERVGRRTLGTPVRETNFG